MYAQNKSIIIVGYPKSGNTYLTRLMGDLLDSPVRGHKNAMPLAIEGSGRAGEYFVTQLHLKPAIMIDENETILNSRYFNVHRWNGECLLHIIRDPRDIAVSTMYYWGLDSIRYAINAMGKGTGPMAVHGPWNEFVDSWLRDVSAPHKTVFYERLVREPEIEIEFIFDELGLPYPSDKHIKRVIERQSFDNKIKEIERDGDTRPHGKEVQLKSMRKGIAGDWKNHFTRADGKLAQEYFGDMMTILGYEPEKSWWANLPA